VRFADAYNPAPQPEDLEERNGVAIDRIYGSVAVGPFNYETAIAGRFETRVDLKNISLAQLALLGLALRDLAEGRIGVGFGKSRGLGRVRVTLDTLTLRYPTLERQAGALRLLSGPAVGRADELLGIGALCLDPSYRGYDFPVNDRAPLPGGLSYADDDLIGLRLDAAGDDQVRSIWRACMPAWRAELAL
jgi:hypothetical protein